MSPDVSIPATVHFDADGKLLAIDLTHSSVGQCIIDFPGPIPPPPLQSCPMAPCRFRASWVPPSQPGS
jgi:hypothetical protein